MEQNNQIENNLKITTFTIFYQCKSLKSSLDTLHIILNFAHCAPPLRCNWWGEMLQILTASRAASSFRSVKISGVDVIIITSSACKDVTSGSSAVVVDVLSVDNSTLGFDVSTLGFDVGIWAWTGTKSSSSSSSNPSLHLF